MDDQQPATVVISRHEQHYACGCTTTRIERILLPQPDQRRCLAHRGQLTRIVHTTEYQNEPVEEAWQLHPND